METDALHAHESAEETAAASYTVVARRYRPKQFTELVGQQHVSQALQRAITSGRVGHAYLFTGARGVGKTSTARIFAKALNASEEMEAELAADVARCIDAGDDMDVIEIDGASNRGIEEIRQLRANVNVRPSRAPYKIYIIDEVHMLTTAAFNALLKTLEEPPSHVKFIFCTTDPDKIPITVLSRCQRFDFTPVGFDAIQTRLKEICQCEGFEADADALALLARRAAGSMRDSQSLLEQVMSFSDERITVEQVHSLLGTADEGRLLAVVKAVQAGDALASLQLIDDAIRSGAEAGQLAEQLLNYLRDLLAIGVGGGPEILKLANPNGHEDLRELANAWGTQTILSAIQILDESLVRMRSSVSSVALLEIALVQICQLESLASIPELLDRLAASPGNASSPGQKQSGKAQEKKKPENIDASIKPQVTASGTGGPHMDDVPSGVSPVNSRQPTTELTGTADSAEVAGGESGDIVPGPTRAGLSQGKDTGEKNSRAAVAQVQESAERVRVSTDLASASALSQWRESVGGLEDLVADFALMASGIEPLGADQWKIVFPPGASKPVEYCQHPARKAVLERALQTRLGRSISLQFVALPGQPAIQQAPKPQASLRAQKMREMSEHPYVKKLCEVLDGEIIRVDMPRQTTREERTRHVRNEPGTQHSRQSSKRGVKG